MRLRANAKGLLDQSDADSGAFVGFLAERQEVEEGMWEVVQNLEVHEALGSLQSLGEHHQVVKRWIQVQPHEVARWHFL